MNYWFSPANNAFYPVALKERLISYSHPKKVTRCINHGCFIKSISSTGKSKTINSGVIYNNGLPHGGKRRLPVPECH